MAPKTAKSHRSVKLTAEAVEALRSHLQRQLEEIERVVGSLYQDTGLSLIFAKEDGTPVRGNRPTLRQPAAEKFSRAIPIPLGTAESSSTTTNQKPYVPT